MIDVPQIAQTEAQHTALIHLTVRRDQIHQVMGPGLSEVRAALAAQGFKPAGPWFTHHLSTEPDLFYFEICVPVSVAVSAKGPVTPGYIPASRVVQTIYRGPYEGLAAAWGEFDTWITAHDLKAGTDFWERYAAGPESSADPADWRTELSRLLVN